MRVCLRPGNYYTVWPGTRITFRHQTICFIAARLSPGPGWMGPHTSQRFDNQRDGVQVIPMSAVESIEED